LWFYALRTSELMNVILTINAPIGQIYVPEHERIVAEYAVRSTTMSIARAAAAGLIAAARAIRY